MKAEVKRGTLRITGNRRGNAVRLRLRRGKRGTLEVDVGRAGRAEFRFKRKAFTRIVLRGGRGSDSLRILNRNGSFTGSERTVVDGGRGSDVLALDGSRGADSLTVAASGRRLRLAPAQARAGAAATRAVTAGRIEHLDIDPGRGADAVTVGNLSGTGVADVALELGSMSGGDGQPDTVVASGTPADDTLSATGGATRVIGGLRWAFGAAHFESSLDRLIVNGLGGVDTLNLSGSDGPDAIDVSGAGGLMNALVGEKQVQSDEVELLRMTPLRGADTISLHDLAGTEVGQATVDLASTPRGPADGETDSVAVLGRNGADNLAVGSAPGISVTGLAALTSIVGGDPSDRLAVDGLGGADTINAGGLAANAALLTIRGGPDADTLTGGPGDDLFVWNPGDGNDMLEGEAGLDKLLFNGNGAAENIDISPNGGRALFFRDVENVPIDMDDVEVVEFNALGGSDNTVIDDMTGTDLARVIVALGAANGAGDGAVDNVILNGTPGPDSVSVTGGAQLVNASGLPAALTITGAESGNDRLTVNGSSGNDHLDATAVGAGAIILTLNGDTENDTLRGGAGPDNLNGGDGSDEIFAGPGDAVDGGAGSNTIHFP